MTFFFIIFNAKPLYKHFNSVEQYTFSQKSRHSNREKMQQEKNVRSPLGVYKMYVERAYGGELRLQLCAIITQKAHDTHRENERDSVWALNSEQCALWMLCTLCLLNCECGSTGTGTGTSTSHDGWNVYKCLAVSIFSLSWSFQAKTSYTFLFCIREKAVDKIHSDSKVKIVYIRVYLCGYLCAPLKWPNQLTDN